MGEPINYAERRRDVWRAGLAAVIEAGPTYGLAPHEIEAELLNAIANLPSDYQKDRPTP